MTTVLQLGPEWLTADYRPDVDESFQLHAAVRAWRGDGFTCDFHNNLSDLSESRCAYLTFWPPLYGGIFLAVLHLGGGIGPAVVMLKVFKAAAAFAGTLGWMRLGNRLLPAPATAVLALGLCAHLFCWGAGGNPTHLLAWAIAPCFLMALWKGLSDDGIRRCAVAGALAALMVATRYPLAALAPAAAAAVLLFSPAPWRGRLLRAALTAVPPVATLAAIMLVNRLVAGQAANLEDSPTGWTVQSTWQFGNLLKPTLLTFWTAFGFGLEPFIVKIKPSLRWAPFAVFLPWHLLFAALAAAAVGAKRPVWDRPQVQFVVAVGLCGAAVMALLGLITARLPENIWWNPISTERYYAEILPAVTIVWLMVLSACLAPPWPTSRAARAAAVLAGVLAAAAIGLESRSAFRTAKSAVREAALTFEDRAEVRPLEVLVEKLLADAAPGPRRVFDYTAGVVKNLRWNDAVPANWMASPRHLAKSGSSRPVYVVLVVRWKPGGEDGIELESFGETTDDGEGYREFFNLPLVGQAPDDINGMGATLCRVYAGWVAPYRHGERPTAQ